MGRASPIHYGGDGAFCANRPPPDPPNLWRACPQNPHNKG